jgi:hypothetical protein
MAASLFVPMARASDQWESDAAEFVKTCRTAAGRCYDRLLDAGKPVGAISPASGTGIIPQLDKLNNDFQSAGYESVRDRAAHHRRTTFMDRAWELAQAAFSLDSVSRAQLSASELSAFRDDLAILRAAAAGGPVTFAFPDVGPFDSFRAKLADARRQGGLSADGFLVLDAMAQFSADVVATAREAELQLKPEQWIAPAAPTAQIAAV